MHPYNPKLKQLSQELRKNMTDAERMLWSKIRMKQLRGLMFSRQKPLGEYIADFYCHEALLVIELDGAIHDQKEQRERDIRREAALKDHRLKVLRFKNEEVLQRPAEVLAKIEATLRQALASRERAASKASG